MTADCHVLAPEPIEKSGYERLQEARLLDSFVSAVTDFGFSQRGFARSCGVPRSTFRDGSSAETTSTLIRPSSPSARARRGCDSFIASSWLPQVTLTLSTPGGIRQVCAFLDLSGLGRFVASSYGAQQEAITALEHEVGCFDDTERARLGAQMPQRRITVAQDECHLPR